MNKKLPRVFANKIDKNISNNKSIYYSKYDEKREVADNENNLENINIYQKINAIFTSEKYVYKAKVDIKLKNGVKQVNVIGHNNGYLITIDNELIPIVDIEDINFSQ